MYKPSHPLVTRRLFCAAPSVLALSSMSSVSSLAATSPSLAEDVATYVGFGEHRAGMPSEARTVNWLSNRLAALGYQTNTQTFPVRTILNPSGQLVVAGNKADLFPQWLPPTASLGKTIDAPLQPLGAPAGAASIRIVAKPVAAGNWGPAHDALVREAVAKGAVGLIMAAEVKTGDVYAFNQHVMQALPIPVGLVAQRDLPALVAAAESENNKTNAQMTLKGHLTDVQSLNVVARKAGKGRLLVISTPLTGWFSCGAERGPGVAVTLRIAAMLAKSERPVLVLGTGSHEIGHLGMEHALKNGAPKPDEVAFWYHFGASLGATQLDAQYGVTSPQFVVGTPTSESAVRPAMLPVMRGYANGNAGTPGEAGQILGAGHVRFAGMIGTFPGFHTPADRGEAIDFVQLEKIAVASESLLARMDAMAD